MSIENEEPKLENKEIETMDEKEIWPTITSTEMETTFDIPFNKVCNTIETNPGSHHLEEENSGMTVKKNVTNQRIYFTKDPLEIQTLKEIII